MTDRHGPQRTLADWCAGWTDDASTDPVEVTARARLASLAVPPGALGQLGELAVRLATIAGRVPPPLPERARLVVAVGDHGVHRHGVSPWPQQLSSVIASTVAEGRAGVSAFATATDVAVTVVDVGLVTAAAPPVLDRRIVAGTNDLRHVDAMTRDDAAAAVLVGIEVAQEALTAGDDVLLTGDAGIANTTASAALIAAMTGATPAAVTGRGTGIDDATLATKQQVVTDAVARLGPRDPIGVLAGVGGAEHAALVGVMLAAARARVPVVLDGVIADAAALVAVGVDARAQRSMIAGHRSPEPGATIALAALGLTPLLDLDLRLGEGSGAVLAVPLLRAAGRLLSEVATLAELRSALR